MCCITMDQGSPDHPEERDTRDEGVNPLRWGAKKRLRIKEAERPNQQDRLHRMDQETATQLESIRHAKTTDEPGFYSALPLVDDECRVGSSGKVKEESPTEPSPRHSEQEKERPQSDKRKLKKENGAKAPVRRLQITKNSCGQKSPPELDRRFIQQLDGEELEFPKFNLSLSRAEKEADFLAMNGTKLPQRPKKRPKAVEKLIQRLHPGAWLTNLKRERYEVRERKIPKNRPRGLLGLQGYGTDSEES